MIAELPSRPMPRWLSVRNPTDHPLPIKAILEQSVYYPACGFDGDPIEYLGGNFHSFIYVDYGVGRDRVIDNLAEFPGYDLEAFRDVAEGELPTKEWEPLFPLGCREAPNGFEDWRKPPFAVWSIYQSRRPSHPVHGPDRISLLYIGGDGVATFQALYYTYSTAPALVAIIQPGHAFGGNWTNFETRFRIFARTVMESPFGTPEYLLHGGQWGSSGTCWREYNIPVATLNRRIRLWKRNEALASEIEE